MIFVLLEHSGRFEQEPKPHHLYMLTSRPVMDSFAVAVDSSNVQVTEGEKAITLRVQARNNHILS